jgi:hypothetical protein
MKVNRLTGRRAGVTDPLRGRLGKRPEDIRRLEIPHHTTTLRREESRRTLCTEHPRGPRRQEGLLRRTTDPPHHADPPSIIQDVADQGTA